MVGVWVLLMSDRPARQGPDSALDQVPLPVDVSAGLTFTGRDPAPRKWSPLTAAELRRQHSTNHIYLFISMTLDHLIMFSYWTEPYTNERLIGTDRAQNHEKVINREKGNSRKKFEDTGGHQRENE